MASNHSPQAFEETPDLRQKKAPTSTIPAIQRYDTAKGRRETARHHARTQRPLQEDGHLPDAERRTM